MGEHQGPATKRAYQKGKRAEDESRTRERIVDAAEHLHSTLGPARTTVSAIAERAGVTRPTVYRHFSDEESLFLACSRQWLSRRQLPDPDGWLLVEDPATRLRTGLVEIYGFYRHGEQMLARIHRDVDAVPPLVVASRHAREQRWLEVLLAPQPGRRRKLVRAAVAHATAFTTWQSLCRSQGLSDRSAADVMVAMAQGVVRGA